MMNSVPCCSICNIMKVCLDSHTFIERCMQIGKGIKCEFWVNTAYKSFAKYKCSTSHEFKLTSEEYHTIRNEKCSYCKRPSSHKHSNGIDRIDSNIGYILENCISCCHDCNISKGKMSPSEFIEHTIKISNWWNSWTHLIPSMPRQPYIWSNLSKLNM